MQNLVFCTDVNLNQWCHFDIFPVTLISILHNCSFIMDNWNLWIGEVPCRICQHEQPAAFLRWVWPTISSSSCALWGCRQRLVGGMEEVEGVYVQPLQQFYFLENLWLAFFRNSDSNLSPTPWGGLLSPLYLSKFLCSSSQTLFFPTSTNSTPWFCCEFDERQGRVTSGGLTVFTCCLALLQELRGGVWWRKGRVCEVSVWMEKEAPHFPPTHTLHILTKESHSVGQTVPDTCEDNPSCAPFIPPCLSSLFFTLSVFLFPSVT